MNMFQRARPQLTFACLLTPIIVMASAIVLNINWRLDRSLFFFCNSKFNPNSIFLVVLIFEHPIIPPAYHSIINFGTSAFLRLDSSRNFFIILSYSSKYMFCFLQDFFSLSKKNALYSRPTIYKQIVLLRMVIFATMFIFLLLYRKRVLNR